MSPPPGSDNLSLQTKFGVEQTTGALLTRRPSSRLAVWQLWGGCREAVVPCVEGWGTRLDLEIR